MKEERREREERKGGGKGRREREEGKGGGRKRRGWRGKKKCGTFVQSRFRGETSAINGSIVDHSFAEPGPPGMALRK